MVAHNSSTSISETWIGSTVSSLLNGASSATGFREGLRLSASELKKKRSGQMKRPDERAASHPGAQMKNLQPPFWIRAGDIVAQSKDFGVGRFESKVYSFSRLSHRDRRGTEKK
jgi:hypothetical protein